MLAENPISGLGDEWKPLVREHRGYAGPGQGWGAHQLRLSGSHQRHGPSGPRRGKPGCWGLRADEDISADPFLVGCGGRVLGAITQRRGGEFGEHCCSETPGGLGAAGVWPTPRRVTPEGPRPLKQPLLWEGWRGPIRLSTLQVTTVRDRELSQDRPGWQPPDAFPWGTGREAHGSGCHGAVVQVTSPWTRSPAPGHFQAEGTPAQGRVGPFTASLALLGCARQAPVPSPSLQRPHGTEDGPCPFCSEKAVACGFIFVLWL